MLVDGTTRTLRCSCETHIPAVQKEPLRDGGPFRFRKETLQISFDLVRIVRGGEAKPIGHSFDMGIDDDTRLAEGVAQNHIGRFSPDAGECDQIIHVIRNLPVEPLHDRFAAGDEMFGFVFEEAGGVNEPLDLRQFGGGVVCWRAIALEQRGGHLIDALIGTLGGEDRGDKEFPW